jgi:aspartate/methionine/tyrosine aminotransferase
MAWSRRTAFERSESVLTTLLAAATGPLVDLTESNPTRVGLLQPGWIARLGAPEGANYAPAALGEEAARAAVARYYARRGVSVDAAQLVLSASTSEAYGWLFKLLCDPGDEVLVPAPGYPLFEHLAQLEAVRARSYRLRYDGRWHLPAGTLAPLIGPRTRALLAVHPNNPTGSCFKHDELLQLSETGLPIVSDEVFSAYSLDPDRDAAPTLLGAGAGLSFTLHGLSKLAGLPQLKLAWLCVDGPEREVSEALARLELIADSFLSVSTPVQLALPAILAAHGEVRDAIRARVRANFTLLRARLDASAISVLHVEAGWYALLRLPAVLDDESWALALLDRHGVLVQPGYFYELEGGPYAVVSLLTIPAQFERGVEQLLAAARTLSAG